MQSKKKDENKGRQKLRVGMEIAERSKNIRGKTVERIGKNKNWKERMDENIKTDKNDEK
jgi:hypothetical protein